MKKLLVLRSIFNITIVPIIISIILLSSCGQGSNDFTEQICGGYRYRIDANIRIILPDNYYNELLLPQIKQYVCDSNFILVHQKPEKKYVKIFLSDQMSFQYTSIDEKIPISVISKYYNFKNFDSLLYKKIKGKFNKEYGVDNKYFFDKIVDSLLINSFKYNKMLSLTDVYWIITCKENIIFGPYTFGEFLKKRNELGVSKKLQLL